MADVEIAIRWAAGPQDVRGAIAVRERVFCEEQGVPPEEESDALDDHALHLVGLSPDGERVVATLRLLLQEPDARIGRVAVLAEWRHRGIASRMLELAVARARAEGHVKARLAAQTRAKGLYERAGFGVESEPFEEAGMPHVWMGRGLTTAAGADPRSARAARA
jgi:predicted GNAT family N-acyltransferase